MFLTTAGVKNRETKKQKHFTVIVSFKEYLFLEVFIILLWLSSLEMDTMNRVQILYEAVCISLCANTPGKEMNPIIVLFAMPKL